MKKLATIILCLVVITPSIHSLETRKKNKKTRSSYARIAGGLLFSKNKVKTCASCVYEKPEDDLSYSGSIALGYEISKNISAEILGQFSSLKYTYHDNNHIDSQKMRSFAIFKNFYLKCPMANGFTPYITSGVGYTFNHSNNMKVTQNSNDDTVKSHTIPGRSLNSFAWNIGFGTIAKINNIFAIDVGYRYISMGKMAVKKGSNESIPDTLKVKTHDILLGLTYHF